MKMTLIYQLNPTRMTLVKKTVITAEEHVERGESTWECKLAVNKIDRRFLVIELSYEPAI